MKVSSRFVGRLKRNLRDYGIVLTFLRILHYLRLISVLHSFEIVGTDGAFEATGGTPSGNENKGQFRFQEIQESELEKLRFADGMYSIETMKMHFASGLRFFAAFDGDFVVAVNGFHPNCADLVYVKMPHVKLPEKVGYFNCALTAPSYRNRSIGSALKQYRLAQVQSEGYKALFAAVFVENRDALRWNLRNSFQYLGRITYLKWRGRDFWIKRLSPVVRRYAHQSNGIFFERRLEAI